MNKTIVTPKGRASWPYLHEPFKNKKDGSTSFKCDLIFPVEEAESLATELNQFYNEEFEKALDKAKKSKIPREARELRESVKKLPIIKERDEEDQLTGNAVLKSKSNKKPMVVDAQGNPFTGKIGAGSIVRLSVSPSFWGPLDERCGVKLWLNAVQVIELVEWGAYGGPKSFEETGFDIVEDGYVAEEGEEEEEDEFATTSTGTASDSNGDF